MVPPTPVAAFERSPVPGAEVVDLDQETLQSYLRRRAPHMLESTPAEQLATSFGLLTSASGRNVPTVAGLMLFGVCPQVLHPEWGVATVRVRGTKLADPIAARADLEGRLDVLLEETLRFVREHTQRVANLVSPADAEPEYAEVAVREALLNALIHRDYRLTGRVAVRIYNDRLEVWSPGGMPVSLSLEHLAQHGGVSFPRNPILAAAARSLGLIDQIGRGLPLIRRAVTEAASLTAQFGASPSDFLVVLPSRLRAQLASEGGN
jgi:ATP-dependent DNA helicase RecG